MNLAEFQQWLNAHGARPSLATDNRWGKLTSAASVIAFTNKAAPAVTATDIAQFAADLGVTEKQVRAVATVESRGGGYDSEGRPKILFERHYFSRLTDRRFDKIAPDISNPVQGGYGKSADQYDRLLRAIALDPGAAFASASWGKFQVMGDHWKRLGYASPVDMAHSMVKSEAGHYAALVAYVRAFSLVDAMRALSANPETCRAFAKGYNGPAYAGNAYHTKLAEAMR